jgi:DNA mismatch repair protein MutS
MHASCLTVLAVQNVVADERRKRIERIMLSSQERAETEEFINACEETFDVDSLLAHDLDNANALTSIFCKGVFKQIDELQNTIQTEMAFIEGLAQELSACIGGGVKVEYLNSCGYYITVKNGRASKLREAVLGDAQLAAMKLSFKTGNMTTRITSNEIDAASRSISERSSTLRASAKRYYKHVLSALHNSYGPLFKRITAHISTLDVTKSNYKTAVMYNYCRPQIVRERTPFIDAYDLRHPIMERIDMETEYIPNNIRIGSEHTGIVLYSMNAGGKTSLLKACGISVILAQMGSFVPASSYSFSPFKSLMTRILSEDNVLKGRSSFVAEMSELRSILKRADGETLVLADEITHGTEHTSGSAIFTSSVMTLAERRVNFMFTTHLHNVYPLIKDMPNVMVCHLSVSVRDGIVVFDRKLTDGPGDSIYGLEVCESLNMDAEFLARAFKIRDKIECNKSAPMLSPLKIKPSRYNKSRLVQSCKICNYSPRCDTDIPLDVHHIKHKCARNDQGFIDNIHVDTLSNLIVLCKQCHIKAHNGDLKIAGYLSTTKGLVLDIDVTRKHFT